MICAICGKKSSVMKSADMCRDCYLAKRAITMFTESRAVLLSTVLKRLGITEVELANALLKYDGTQLSTFKRVALASIPKEELAELSSKHTTSQIAVILGFGEPYIRSTLIKHGIQFTTTKERGRPRVPDDQKAKPKPRKSKRVDTKLVPQHDFGKQISPIYERALDRAKRLGYID